MRLDWYLTIHQTLAGEFWQDCSACLVSWIWSWIGVAGTELLHSLVLGGEGLILPSIQEEHFLSAQLSKSYWPWPMIRLPEHSLPIITAITPNTITTISIPTTGPTESCSEALWYESVTGGGCSYTAIDILTGKIKCDLTKKQMKEKMAAKELNDWELLRSKTVWPVELKRMERLGRERKVVLAEKV